MRYLSDEEQEIWNEGFSIAKINGVPYCPYDLGTLGYELFWKGYFDYETS